jgi:hypothetical protein
MRVYVNRKPVDGPWGGGAKVLRACIDALRVAGHEVVHAIDPTVDVIYCVDPRQGSDPDQLGYAAIKSYLTQRIALSMNDRRARLPNIVQRVGDLGTHDKPDLTQLVLASVMQSDTVIFPSVWAHDFIIHVLEMLDVRPTKQWHVIPNAAVKQFFAQRCVRSGLPEKLSFVTHHWSNNPNKGFGFYAQLREWCRHNGHRFTYIGRAPDGFEAVSPMGVSELSHELPHHNVYVTASREEAGANHVLEGLAAGLPVIYSQDGGSIPEYCSGMGVSFDGSIDGFVTAVAQLRTQYPKIRQVLRRYRRTVDDVAIQYKNIIEGVAYRG